MILGNQVIGESCYSAACSIVIEPGWVKASVDDCLGVSAVIIEVEMTEFPASTMLLLQ